MKLKHWILLAALLSASVCTGCSASGVTAAEAAEAATVIADTPAVPEETAAPETAPAAPETAPAAPENPYASILNRCYAILSHSETVEEPGDGEVALWETAAWLDSGDALASIGYAITDVSEDGISELLIGTVADNDGTMGNQLYAVYTCVDGQPHLIAEGQARNRYYLLGDDCFFNEGSSGAMYSVFATYSLNNDATELNCDGFWFTYEKAEGSDEIGYYYNTTGEYNRDTSQEISSEEYVNRYSELQEQTVNIALTPFSTYTPEDDAEPAKTIQGTATITAVHDQLAEPDFIADLGDPQTVVAFHTDRPVSDFTFLRYHIAGEDADGTPLFETEELTTIGTLTENIPFVVVLTFHGDLPEYGIRYVDSNGRTVSRTLELSGEDGSLLLIEQV